MQVPLRPSPRHAASSLSLEHSQKTTGKDRLHRSRGKIVAREPQPEASGSNSENSSQKQSNGKQSDVAFGDGLDFIAFELSNDVEEGGAQQSSLGLGTHSLEVNGRDKGKGKEKEVPLYASDHGEKERVRSRTPPQRSRDAEREQARAKNPERARERYGRWDRTQYRDRDRDKDGLGERDRDGGRGRQVSRDRDRRRGPDGSENGMKRKFEAAFNPGDNHVNKKLWVDASSRRFPWVDGLDWSRCHHVAEVLHKEVEAFTNWISPTPVEDEVRSLIVSLITRAVTETFPDASVLPFGSYETKLYLPLGDIDLVILSQSMAYSNKIAVLHALANTFRRAGITDRVTIVAKAKVPIVKFITSHGRFNVDISVNQEGGVISGRIINGFLHDMHDSGPGGKRSIALRSLVMITKAFLNQRGMNEVFTGGLGSYSIVCLAISFLQMHPKIRKGEIDAEQNLGVLLMEFFELYGCYFNYEEVGISVRDGGTYFSKKQRGWHNYAKSGLLSIEDPADPSNDISGGSYGFQKVRATLAGAHGILTSTAYLRAGIIASRREGRSVHLRSHDTPGDMSILSSVMGVTQETINHRMLVQELYDKKTLHNLLGVKPKPATVDSVVTMSGTVSKSRQPSPSPSHEVHDVISVWKEAEVDPEERHHKRRRDHDRSDNEEGRYDIGRHQRQKKRRKAGRRGDTHTHFTTDIDLTSTIVYALDSEGEEEHYASDVSLSRQENLERTEQRRSYWSSKAISTEEVSLRG